MKILAETTGEFMLTDPANTQALQAHRPSVITITGFMQARIALGQIAKIADVGADATDEDFAEYWATSDGDRDLAISSYLSKFEAAAEQAPKPAPKPAGKKGK